MTGRMRLLAAVGLAGVLLLAVPTVAAAQETDVCGVETGTAEPDDGGGVVGSPGEVGEAPDVSAAEHCPVPTTHPDFGEWELYDGGGGVAAEGGEVTGGGAGRCTGAGGGSTTGSGDSVGDSEIVDEDTAAAYAADAVGLTSASARLGTCRTRTASGVLAAARIDAGGGAAAADGTGPTVGGVAILLLAVGVLRRRRARV
jgi:hypothetical protein